MNKKDVYQCNECLKYFRTIKALIDHECFFEEDHETKTLNKSTGGYKK